MLSSRARAVRRDGNLRLRTATAVGEGGLGGGAPPEIL